MLQGTQEHHYGTEEQPVVVVNPHTTRQKRNMAISMVLTVCVLALAVYTVSDWDSFKYETCIGLLFLIILSSTSLLAWWYRYWEQRDP